MRDNEGKVRADLIAAARKLSRLGLLHGSTGNISLRIEDRIMITPTGSSLADLEPQDLSLIDSSGAHVGGPRPSKEGFLHLAIQRARPDDNAVVHTHSTHAVAVSCLDGLDLDAPIPPLTAYFVLKVGRVKLLPYRAPGDQTLGPLAERAAADESVLLLRNHGPIASGGTLEEAIDRIQELEEVCRIFLLLGDRPTRPLSLEEATALNPSLSSEHQEAN
ncbi:MAG TPA: class II aldolase/adducin family protein [Galbitalea sp.]